MGNCAEPLDFSLYGVSLICCAYSSLQIKLELVMFRFLTAGESHGPCLTMIVEGLPAGLTVEKSIVNADLHRRQGGYGRGGRMKIERDTIRFLSGVRHEIRAYRYSQRHRALQFAGDGCPCSSRWVMPSTARYLWYVDSQSRALNSRDWL